MSTRQRLQKKSFAIVVTCICFFLFGCSDTEAILKENEKQGTKIQTKISSALLELEKSSDEVKRIQASQSLFNILAENQDISSLNHRNALVPYRPTRPIKNKLFRPRSV